MWQASTANFILFSAAPFLCLPKATGILWIVHAVAFDLLATIIERAEPTEFTMRLFPVGMRLFGLLLELLLGCPVERSLNGIDGLAARRERQQQ